MSCYPQDWWRGAGKSVAIAADFFDSSVQAAESGSEATLIEIGKEMISRAKSEDSAVAEALYKRSLALLEEGEPYHGMALEFGRLSYGLKRSDGKPTADDEGAIRREIEARLKG